MQPKTWTASSIAAFKANLQRNPSWLVPVKDSALKESIPRGLGFNTEAALVAALKETPELPSRVFDTDLFVDRLSELSDGPSAETVEAVLTGAGLEISICKRQDARQQSGRYWDIAYDVEVRVTGVPAEILEKDIIFHLPQFGRDYNSEPYRVDSAHDRRVAAEYLLRHFGTRSTTRVAKLLRGHWYGGFYVYAHADQIDDERCIQAAKTALARAILPSLPTKVRCAIFKPDNYEAGRAWRVEMRLPENVLKLWHNSTFSFELPRMEKWLIQTTAEYRHNGIDDGRFVDGVWRGDLYSNGVPEKENLIRLAQVKRRLLKNVDDVIRRSDLLP
ncbi:hypothetical protein [Paludibacterium sp. B53371]|uniref:hypothetical protein n=1 Tax=Paludibacterium sp. B53371 TaxID=2806263 RepID=UPI001C04D33E|nr:hypothetical protein [Paludibacterium sp. B53371]